ncbi:MAG: glycoside hydrolase family 172 protein [Tepidisphaerales bacterium]
MKRFVTLAALVVVAAGQMAVAQGKAITLESLLNEMIDRDAVARWPEPSFTAKQTSSYDRASKTPDDPKTWYANNDTSQFYGHEDRDGRREWIMLDADGPGAIVRFWNTAPHIGGTLRFYFDGAEKPAIEGKSGDLLIGNALVEKPLAIFNAPVSKTQGGMNLYLPIPYAKHCKVTYSEDDPKNPLANANSRYYNIEYRTYPAGTNVKTFTMADLKAAKGLVDKVNQSLAEPQATPSAGLHKLEQDLAPGKKASIDLSGPAAVRQLTLKVSAADPAALEHALRTAIVRISFDDEECVWAPAGDFFGSGIGLNDHAGWWRSVKKSDGAMTCWWVMPYQKTAKITIENAGKAAMSVQVTATTKPWTWDARSMHFRANWRSQHALPTRPMSDWNYITITGKGLYLGDNLSVFNPVPGWWGEGDEHIYVDGETFPSHFGTGTEDYYCYAWCSPHLFQGPFANQTRCDGPGNAGHTSITRVRSLDAVSFEKGLRFDMEVWHWVDTKVDYAATTYWYALPGATSNRMPQPEEAAMAISENPLKARSAKIAGAVECETAEIVAKSPGLETEIQDVGVLQGGGWSDGKQLWVRGRRAGDFIELKIPAAGAGQRKLTLYATKSWDYGILRFSVNGQPAGKDFDSFAPQAVASGPIELGAFEPKDGGFIVRVEVVGANAQSKNSKSFFGLDCVVVGKAN